MIVTSLGYGYTSSFLLKEIASHGVKCVGITDKTKYHKQSNLENISILPRSKTIKSITKSTHLVVTAPPNKNKCPVLISFVKFSKIVFLINHPLITTDNKPGKYPPQIALLVNNLNNLKIIRYKGGCHELSNTLFHDSASYQKYIDSLTGKFDKKGMTNIKYINVANSYS